MIDQLARAWIGVPWKHLGRSKSGVDCIGLVLLVLHEAGFQIPDPKPYTRDPDGTKLTDGVTRYSTRDQLVPGRVILFRAGAVSAHVGLSSLNPNTGVLSVIHAYAPYRKVVEQPFDDFFRAGFAGAYMPRL